MVLQNAERRNNTAEKLIQNDPPILTQTWLTTIKEILSDPFGSIWVRPVDYRDALKDTPFDLLTHRPQKGYRRQAERESLVGKHIQRRRLLDG